MAPLGFLLLGVTAALDPAAIEDEERKFWEEDP